MADNLEEIFRRYWNAVQSKLQQRGEERRVEKGPLRLFVNKAMELRAEIDELENQAEFEQLVGKTNSSFSGDYHGKSEGAWQQAVKNFFRRSGYYIDLFEGKSLSVDAALHNYREALQRRETQISYFAPMEYVYFAERTMDFGAFHIRRFAAGELEAIFQNRINEVFYPWAVIDVKRLKDYWFVYLTEPAPVPRLGRIYVDWSELKRVQVEYTRFPRAIEAALQQIVLFDWQADWWNGPSAYRHEQQERDLERGWLGFSIPFVLRVRDNLLDSPSHVPDLSRLETEPFLDPQTGEEIGEVSVTYIHLNKNKTDAFKAFIQCTGSLLASLRAKQNGWQFLEVALGNFIKAFFAEGLEQMLWHITTLEAVLGEKGEGVTERLAQRIASILGRSEEERKAIRKQFKELYAFRCDLVHGNPFQKQTYIGHLRDARNLARRTLLWFLHYLGNIQAGIPGNQRAEGVPTREDILTLLDLDQNSRARLGWLIDTLPVGFPSVSEWVG